MRFLLDANMPRAALTPLMRHGHDARHVKDLGLGTAPDDDIAARACADEAVLVTRDLDFADVRSYPPQGTPGLLVLRVPDDWAATQIAALQQFLSMDSLVASLPGHLAIIDQRQVRFRPALGPSAFA